MPSSNKAHALVCHPVMTFILTVNELDANDQIYLFSEGRLLTPRGRLHWRVEQLQSQAQELEHLHLIHHESVRHVTTHVSPTIASSLQAEEHSLRSLLMAEGAGVLATIGKANQILDWHESQKYCGRCGAETVAQLDNRVLLCSGCQKTYFPRINPCIIVLVTKGDEILLARNAHYKGKFLSCLAGFIEVGESAEETLHREVKEEVGIEVENIRYVKSQCWPFPSQLMLGFYADYKSGDIVPDEVEIEFADWFNINDMPTIPNPGISVAGELITGYIAARKAGTICE